MKITKKQLKQIIKEEIGEIDEGLFDKVATYFGGGSREKKAKQFLERGMEELKDGGTFPWAWAIKDDIIRGDGEGGRYEKLVWRQARKFWDSMRGPNSPDSVSNSEKDGGLPDELLYSHEKEVREKALGTKRREEEEYEAQW